MKKASMILVAMLSSVSFFAFAQNAPVAVVVTEKALGSASVTEAAQLQGKVKSVDTKARRVVVIGATGNEVVFNAGEEVKNFNQIKVGDLVTLSYTQALALELRKTTNPGVPVRVDSERSGAAAPGQKPGMITERTVQVIANVVAVNPKAQTVTLRGAKQTVDLYVKDPVQLQNIKVGDQVEGLYVEAVALTVSAEKTKK